MHHVYALKLVLKIELTGQILLIKKHVWVAMLGDFLFKLGNEVVVLVEELGVFLDFSLSFTDFGEVILVVTVIFNQ